MRLIKWKTIILKKNNSLVSTLHHHTKQASRFLLFFLLQAATIKINAYISMLRLTSPGANELVVTASGSRH